MGVLRKNYCNLYRASRMLRDLLPTNKFNLLTCHLINIGWISFWNIEFKDEKKGMERKKRVGKRESRISGIEKKNAKTE